MIKWAGGKYRLSETIIEMSQRFIDWGSFDRYVEPFVGGGGMFFAISNRFSFKEKVISDINADLVNLYLKLRDDSVALLSLLQSLEADFNSQSSDEEKELFYYTLREKFNRGILTGQMGLEHAAFFVALNRLGFNGLYRVNSQGLFNVPFGKKSHIKLVDVQNFQRVRDVLQNTEILLGDFEETLRYADSKTLFYFDSPYRPISDTAAFTAYAKGDFNDQEQRRLAQFCERIYGQEATFVLSNSDPKNTDKTDGFFDDLYQDYKIMRIEATRLISARAGGRGRVSEILVIGD
ncbi:MAG: Dam family site-specific DNA-(adenine-N6)-methyltransferase [Alcaligenaceae bacterium]|nr:Dam family site-specific DNA-(adenine-N6)-methyltransferase [Alcaligenaceae bacterium]